MRRLRNGSSARYVAFLCENICVPPLTVSQIPDNFTMEQAITVPENLVTAFNVISADLGLPTPWPKPKDYVPPKANERILIWGAASSVGNYTIQVLKFYGYRHLIATASPRHHEFLKQLGAEQCFDYRNPAMVDDMLKQYQQGDAPAFPMIVDCIGSQEGSVGPISKIAMNGTTVAVMLPVILKHATEEEAPEYSMDASTTAQWAEGVNVRGVRTHFYWQVGRCPLKQEPNCSVSTNNFQIRMNCSNKNCSSRSCLNC